MTDEIPTIKELEGQWPVPPIAFRWTPSTTTGPMFEELRNKDGDYVCPWPDCGHTTPGKSPQGIGRHLTYAHDWASPRPTRRSHNAARKTQERKKFPSDTRKVEQIICAYQGCGRSVRRDYLRNHLRHYHKVGQERLEAVLNGLLDGLDGDPTTPGVKAARTRAARKAEPAPLSAKDICRTVLLEVAPGQISIDALDAYLEWVDATEKFLAAVLL